MSHWEDHSKNIDNASLASAASRPGMAAAGLARFRSRRQIEEDSKEERLYFAVQSGDARRLEQLIESGCNPDHKFEGSNHLNRRLLHLSCEKGQEECAAVLLQHGANPEPQDSWFQTPLMYSVCTERDNMVKLMLQQDIDINMTDKFGRSALHIAINNVEQECLKLLINSGADLNISDEHGKNPLYHAIMVDGRADVVKTLIKNKCNVNNRDMREKRMPLAAAIMNAKQDVLTYSQLLLEAGADPNAPDNFGFTPMTSLIKRGFRDGAVVQDKHMQIASLLVRHGHDVNVTIEAKYWFQYSGTSLKLATERNCPKLVEFLLQNHADPDIADDTGVTPLHVAASKDYLQIAKLLVAANANLNLVADIKVHQNAPETFQVTPIKYALLNGSKQVPQFLLAVGCIVTHDDYLWCEINVSHWLQNSPPFVSLSASASRTNQNSVGRDSDFGANLRRSNTDVASHFTDLSGNTNHAVNPLLRSNTGLNSSAATSDLSTVSQFLDLSEDVQESGANDIQTMLSNAACQPRGLFQQSILYIRKLLGQPFNYKVSRLLKHDTLEDVVPIYRLQAWLHLTHLTEGLDTE